MAHATPPFSINENLPGDSDIVSQHPANARSFRDNVEGWLLVNHNNLGQHKFITLPETAVVDVPSGVADTLVVYVNENGNLVGIDDLRGTSWLGVPPGTVIWSASSSLLNGYLWPTGSGVSRTTFADLFAVIGVAFGAGDGSTTFQLPDIRARMIVGRDNLGGSGTTSRITSGLTGGISAASLANVGGADRHSLLQVELPTFTPAGTISGTISIAFSTSQQGTGAVIQFFSPSGSSGSSSSGITYSPTFSGNSIGGNAAHNNMPPAIVLNPMIKY